MVARSPRPAVTIAVVTVVALVLELTSIRLFAYIGSAQATSTALSIALLGLGAGAAIRVRWPRGAAPPRAASGLALALLALVVATVAGASLPWLAALALVPFALAGMLVADAYAARGRAATRATYAIDLFAAACGCLVAPRLLGPLGPVAIMAALGLVGCGLALTLVERRGRTVAALAIVALAHASVLVLGGALPDGPLAAMLGSDPRSEKAIVEAGTSARDVVDSVWSPLGRLDVRRLPADGDLRLGVFTDGMSPTYLVKEAEAKTGAFEATWGLLMALPYRALRPARVLVLGAGAGASVWLALRHGAARVDAVEVNPAIPELLARWRTYAGDVYHEPGAQLHIADARRYLADTSDRYDLIELALALTGNAHAQPAGMEAQLYTVEAVELYLDHLSPTGVLVLVHSDPGNAYRQLLTVLEALDRRGTPRARALDHIAVLRDPRPGTAYRYLLVVGTAPMPLDVADRLDVEPAELLWGPGDPPERGAELLDPAKLGATSRDDLAPVYDDRPYFFQNTRGLVATARAEPGRLWVLAGAVLLGLVLVAERRRDARSFARPAGVAAGLGAAYLCVELALVQRFTLAAGGTLSAVSFVLFCLLGWSAVGALLLGERYRRRARGVSWACAVAGLAVGGTALLGHDLAWLDAIASDAARLVAIAALLAPAGLAIGGPFPVLLAHHGEPAARIASLWAINGAAAVGGGVVAVLALRVAGSTDALLVAAAVYGVAAVLAPAGG